MTVTVQMKSLMLRLKALATDLFSRYIDSLTHTWHTRTSKLFTVFAVFLVGSV